MNSSAQSVLVWLCFLFALSFYFLPSLIAVARLHERPFSIALANLFLGWTVIGWVLALSWALGWQGGSAFKGSSVPEFGRPPYVFNPERLATILFLAVGAAGAILVLKHHWISEQRNSRMGASVAARSAYIPAATPSPRVDRIALANQSCPLTGTQRAVLTSFSTANVDRVYDLHCSVRRLLLDHMTEIEVSKRDDTLPRHVAEFRVLEHPGSPSPEETAGTGLSEQDWIALADRACPLSPGQQQVLASFSPVSIERIYRLDCDLRRRLLDHMAEVKLSRRDQALDRHIIELMQQRGGAPR